MIAIHIKTGSRYRILYYATDCTNSRAGTLVVAYQLASGGPIYVRDAAEFSEKFKVQS